MIESNTPITLTVAVLVILLLPFPSYNQTQLSRHTGQTSRERIEHSIPSTPSLNVKSTGIRCFP